MSSSASLETSTRFRRERAAILDEVTDRVVEEAVRRAWSDERKGLEVEFLLSEAAVFEISRLEAFGDDERPDGLAFWRDVAQRVPRAGEQKHAEILHALCRRYLEDIAGDFRPQPLRDAARKLPGALDSLLDRVPLRALQKGPAFPEELRGKIAVEGEVGKLRRLSRYGTLVYVPTHQSHMDSVVLGAALDEASLPPVMYGAGRNVLQSPLSRIMTENLTVYRIDRRVRNTIYKEVLKEFSQVLIERRYHSLFFPSGGRSRTGEIEDLLKLGLLGTAVEAYLRKQSDNRVAPNVYVVPVALSYPLVLEAETLVEDYLARGERRPSIIEVDEFSDPTRVRRYVDAIASLHDAVTVRFGRPMDVVGNEVDNDGESRDAKGRAVETQRYFWKDGVLSPDRLRDRAYTRQLAGRVVSSFQRSTVHNAANVVCFALFEHLQRQHAGWDLFRVMRFCRDDAISSVVAEGETERVLRLVRRAAEAGRLRVTTEVATKGAPALLDTALRIAAAYHEEPFLVRAGDAIQVVDPTLVFFYGNRLRGYDIEWTLSQAPGGYTP